MAKFTKNLPVTPCRDTAPDVYAPDKGLKDCQWQFAIVCCVVVGVVMDSDGIVGRMLGVLTVLGFGLGRLGSVSSIDR